MSFLSASLALLLALPLGMGVGGGGLFLVYLSDVLGLEREAAVYLNLVFFLSALLSSAVAHLKAGRLLLPFLGTILLFGIPGAFLGRALASLLSLRLLRVLLAIFLVSTGLWALFAGKKRKDTSNALDKPQKKNYNET